MGALFLKAIANIVCYQNHVIQKNLTSSHSHDIVIKLSLTVTHSSQLFII